MKIQDFADMEKFESIMSDWAKATGLATVAVGADGKYISGRLERYVEGQISGELVGEIVELTEFLTGLVPYKFIREDDNFSTIISIQNKSIDFLKKYPSVNRG